MPDWITSLISKLQKTQAAEPDEKSMLALQQERQKLHLELDENQHVISRLRTELERQRLAAEALAIEKFQAKMNRLLIDLAAPAAQMATLLDLAENQGKAVQARDVLVVCKRLLGALKENQVTLEGEMAGVTGYDPNLHEPLDANFSPQIGQPVAIRFPGLAYQGRLIRKAGVSTGDIPQG